MEDGELLVNLRTRRVWRGTEELYLTPRELAVLCYLARNAGRVIGDNELLDAVWGSDATIGDAALRTVIRQLRHKLGDDARDPRHIFTVWGRGYRFEI
jgi:DNA-binding response OmpR family regulator